MVSGDLRKTEKAPVFSWSSGFSKPEDAAEFQAIFKNDDSDIENGLVPSRLNAVKSKLRRHLSRDSGLRKRTSRSSVGNSEAEAARREELRQIRKKRIQDELGDRLEYDDDAKFLCSSPLEPASTRRTANLTEDAQNVSPIIPRTLLRRHSFSIVDKRAASPDRGSDKDRRKRSSIPEMPPSPVLKPQSLSTIDDVCTRRTSWRLSFSSDNRSRSLRALSEDHSQSLSKGYSSPALIHTELPFAVTSDMRWLRSQGLRLPSKSTMNENLQRHDDVRDLGGVDGITEASTTVIPLHEMQISQRLASSGLPSHFPSSPQLSISRSSDSRAVSNSDDGFQAINVRRSKYFRGTSDSELNESKTSPTSGPVLRDTTTSYSMSDGNKFIRSTKRSSTETQPSSSSLSQDFYTPTESPQGAQVLFLHHGSSYEVANLIFVVPSLILTLPDKVSTIDISNEQVQDANANMGSVKATESNRINLSLLAPSNQFSNDHQIGLDGTESLRQGIVEQHRTSIPVTSRFTENFDGPVPKTDARLSFLSTISLPRLGRLTTRSYDGSGSVDCSNSFPGRRSFGYKLSLLAAHDISTSIASNTEGMSPNREDTTISWNKALAQSFNFPARDIQREIETRPPSSMTRTHIYPKYRRTLCKPKIKNNSFEAPIDDDKLDQKTRLATDLSALQVPTITFQEFKWETLESAQTTLSEQSGIQEMEAKISLSQVSQHSPNPHGSPTMPQGRSFPRPAIPPKSWSRYPSHMRPKLCESAGPAKKVDPTEYAAKELADGIHKYREKTQHHSLPQRLSMKVRTSFDKLRKTKSATMNIVLGRRSSTSISGVPKAPELELETLPLDVQHNTQLRHSQIEAAMSIRRREQEARMTTHPASIHGSDGLDEEAGINIADPKFYADCVVDRGRKSSRSVATCEDLGSPAASDREASKRGRFGTWSGRDRRQMVERALRVSTVDFMRQIEVMERLERERALRAADEILSREA
jgi:hypothetical protein